MPKRVLSRTKSRKNYARNRAAYLSARNPKERRSKRTGRLGSKKLRQADRQQPRQRQRSKRVMTLCGAQAASLQSPAACRRHNRIVREDHLAAFRQAAKKDRLAFCVSQSHHSYTLSSNHVSTTQR